MFKRYKYQNCKGSLKLKRQYYLIGFFLVGALIWGHFTYLLATEEIEAYTLVTPANADDRERKVPLSMQEYVFEELKRELGMKEAIKAVSIVQCESRWNPDNFHVNRNGSVDLGLWQINSIHKDISNADKFDYKKATAWTIEKRKRDGNWNAWVCNR